MLSVFAHHNFLPKTHQAHVNLSHFFCAKGARQDIFKKTIMRVRRARMLLFLCITSFFRKPISTGACKFESFFLSKRCTTGYLQKNNYVCQVGQNVIVFVHHKFLPKTDITRRM